MKRSDARRVALVALLVVAVAAAIAWRDALDPEALRLALAQAGWWAPVGFVLLYAAATVLFLPGSVMTLAAGALFGPLAGALYSLAGATLGAAAAFLVARHLAADWAMHRAGPRLRELVEGVEAEGWRFVAFLRLMPLFPFNVVNYALGLTRIPLRAYVLASAVCMAPGALAYAWLGHAGQSALAGSEDAIRAGLIALALLALVLYLPRLVRRFRPAVWVTVEQLRALLGDPSVALVDVRDAKAFHGDAGHIAGSRHVPLEDIDVHLSELEPWRAGGLILICRTHKRSSAAARRLAGRGFAGLRVVRGGIESWRGASFPLVVSAAGGIDERDARA